MKRSAFLEGVSFDGLVLETYKSAPQECPTRVSNKEFPQECFRGVSDKSLVPQECPKSVS